MEREECEIGMMMREEKEVMREGKIILENNLKGVYTYIAYCSNMPTHTHTLTT